MELANLSKKKSILIIDDELDIREGCKRILGKMEYAVHTENCGENGLRYLENNNIDVILLDLMMPGIGGMEVLHQVRNLYPNVLVIILTGFATLETAVEAMKQGAYDFLSKPVMPDQVRIVMKRALEKHSLTLETKKLQLERQKTLADLDTEQSRIRGIVESLPNGLIVTDKTGKIVLMNPAFLEHLNLPRYQKPGSKLDDYISDPGFKHFVEGLSKNDTDQNSEEATYEFCTKTQRNLLVHGRPILDDSKKYQGVVLVLVDITAVKILDRLKSEFVAKVSHELRSPLATIHEQLNIVLKHTVKNDSNNDQHILTRAKEKTSSLISLIGDLLDLSRIEVGASGAIAEEIDISKLLTNIVDFLSTRAESNQQKLTFHPSTNQLPLLIADPLELESIFGNLITNAIIYSPPKSNIDVYITAEDSFIVVSVKDDGFGIAEAHLNKIFDKFYRVKTDKTRMITGTGLGLPIVKGLVDDLNGDISIKSTEGKGSTFTVKIPVSKAV
ncbi:MAG: response regulator [Deltaproteobacteria bacterium]|jgi:two-component system, OmpR family, phosphate regulon sensor histidine kinase PhoR|nr:response regulator [Deltaproteobacteria bacterium]